MEADRLSGRRRVAERVRAALAALRAVADLRLAFFRDLATAQGHALLENKAIALCFQNDAEDLEHARAPLALTDTDIEQITTLTTRPGLYSSTYMISAAAAAPSANCSATSSTGSAARTPRTTSHAAPPLCAKPAGTTGRHCDCSAPPSGTNATATRQAP